MTLISEWFFSAAKGVSVRNGKEVKTVERKGEWAHLYIDREKKIAEWNEEEEDSQAWE